MHTTVDVVKPTQQPNKPAAKWTKFRIFQRAFSVTSVLVGVALCVYFFGPFAKKSAGAEDDVESGKVVAICEWEGNGSYKTSGKGELLMQNSTSSTGFSWRNVDLSHSNGPQLFFYASNNDASYDNSDKKVLTTANGGKVLEGTSSFALPTTHENPHTMLNYCELGFVFGKCTLTYL